MCSEAEFGLRKSITKVTQTVWKRILGLWLVEKEVGRVDNGVRLTDI